MTYNVRNIAIALVLAAIAAFLVIAYTGNVQSQVHKNQQTTKVLVAASDIVAGTSVADAVAGGQFQVRDVVQSDMIAGALTSTNQLNQSLKVGQNIYAGQQITGAMFSNNNDLAIGAQIKANYRAEQISLDGNAVMVGTLKAGDHVDLVGTYTIHSQSSGDFDVSRIIVRDVVVLSAPDSGAAGGKLSADTSKPSVMLAVPDTVVPKINFTLHAGDGALWLVLRPSNGAQDGATTLATVKTVIFDGLTPAQVADAFGLPTFLRGH